MADTPSPAGGLTANGVTLGSGASLTVGAGDVVGRDKIVNNIQNIYQRTLTAAEEATQERAQEGQALAQGVSEFVSRLHAIASDTSGEDQSKSPYKGLLSYGLDDAEIFYGRSKAIQWVLERLERGSFMVLHSESGAGKSSLAQAGISPRLIISGDLPVYIRPYNVNPSLVLKRTFLADLGQTPLLTTTNLRDFLRQVTKVLGPTCTLYVILDQGEELFTQLEEAARNEFVGELAECLNDPSLNVKWMLSLRTEYFGNLANFRPRVQNPFENDYRLNRLDREGAREVIVEPARRRGISFEEGLVDKLLDDLGKDNLPPPQLQLVCSALYEGLDSGQTAITRAQYDSADGAAGILRDHLEQVLSRDLPPPERVAARRLLESLITSEQQRVIRSHTELAAELTKRGVTPETLDVILNQLIDSRLIRVHEAKDQSELAYELAHDYLLEEIKLDPNVQARKAAQELLEQEVRAYRRFKTLMSADRLRAIQPFRNELRFTPEAEELFNASLAEVERERLAEEERRQKDLDDARALAEAQRQKADVEKQRADEQEKARAVLSRRNRLITYVGVVAVALAAISLMLFGIANNARNEADAQRGLAVAQQSTAEAASTQAIAQQSTAQAEAQSRATQKAIADANAAAAEREARLARSRQLAAQAQNFIETRVDLALLLGVEAYRTDQTTEAQSSLLTSLQYNPSLTTFLRGHAASVPGTGFTCSPTDTGTPPSSGAVRGLAFSLDGKLLASAGEDRTVILWDVERQTQLATLTGHQDWVYSVAFSPDGVTLASASGDCTIVLWDVADPKNPKLIGQPLRGHQADVNTVAFSLDGRKLVSASQDTTIILWDVATQSIIGQQPLRGHNDRALRAVFQPNGERFASVSNDSEGKTTVIFWDVATRQIVTTLADIPTNAAKGLAFSPDGKLMAMGGPGGSSILWDLTGDAPRQLNLSFGENPGTVYDLTFSPDSQKLLVGNDDGALTLWNLENAANGDAPTPEILYGYSRLIYSLAFNPDGRTLATGHLDSVIALRDADHSALLNHSFDGHTDTVSGAVFTADGKLISAGWDRTLIFWDATTGQLDGAPLPGHNAEILSLALSPDGKRLASGDAGGAIILWDAATREQIAILPGHTSGVRALAFSRDGNILVSGSSDKTIWWWDLTQTPPAGKRITGDADVVNALAFGPDGILAAGNAEDVITLWDLAVSNTEPLAKITNVQTGGIFSLTFNPDGTRLLAGNGDGSLVLWDVSEPKGGVKTSGSAFIFHTRPATGIAFSPDGKLIASASADGDVVLWEAASHNAIGQPFALPGAVYTVAFSPDGKQLLAGGRGGALYVWDMDIQSWETRACAIAARNLTPAEWTQYFTSDYQLTCPDLPVGK